MRNRIVRATSPLSSIAYSSYYVGHWKCTQAEGDGDVADASGNSRDLALGSSLVDDGSGVWGANYGYLTMPGKVDGDADGANFSAVAAWDYPAATWSETGLIASFWFRQATAAQTINNVIVLGTGGYGNNTGWAVRIDASGVFEFAASAETTPIASANSTSDIDDDAYHHVVIAYDGPTDLVTAYVDGVADATLNAADVAGAAAAMSGTNAAFAFGTNTLAAAGYAAPGQYRDVHVLHVPGGVPDNIGYLVKRLRGYPFAPLTDDMIG